MLTSRKLSVWAAALAVVTAGGFLPMVSGGSAARAAASEVLILDATVSGGASSLEAQEVTAQGFTPVVVDDATWEGMTTAQFASYRAIVIGDPTCGSYDDTSHLTAALSNPGTWGAAVNGNVLIIGTDPVYHSGGTLTSGPGQLVAHGVDFALAQAGKTGAYIDLSCAYGDMPANTPVTLLDGIRSGGFSVDGGPSSVCYDDAHIVATHPALAGLTDADLSNWGCSVHESFDTWPADYTVLAMARNFGSTYTASDGTVGEPYILASGTGLHSFPLSLSPVTQNAAVGSAVSVTAQLLDSSTSAPVAGQQIDFRVDSGPDAGISGTCSTSCTTDANGQATWSFTGSHATAGATDTVQAWIDTNGDGTPSAGEPQTTAAVNWTAPTTSTVRYVALGDSYSSGEGVPDASGKFISPTNTSSPRDRCHRSFYAYSQDVAGTKGFPPESETAFWACSGAIIADYTHPNADNNEPSQQSHLLNPDGSPNSSISLVTLTMGGNDVEFPYIVSSCLAIVNCQFDYGLAITALINHTEPRLRRLYQGILHDAPKAQVFVLGYPRILATHPSYVCQVAGIQPGEATWFDRKASQLDAAISRAVSEAGHPSRLHYVSTLNAFAGGEACSRSGSTGGAFMNGIVARHPVYSFHPNKAGQEILASLLAHAVRGR